MKRFWNKVDKTDTCWLWTGCLTLDKYGRFWFNNKIILAHRFSWEFHNGAIPEELFVCHKCDVRNCVNPDHLFLGTHQDNMSDKVNKGRLRVANGENQGHSKLTELQVIEIKKALQEGGNQRLLGLKYGVNQSCIGKIKAGTTWSHVKI